MTSTNQSASGIDISSNSACELVRLGAAQVLDVRQPFELDAEGRIPDAIHIPLFHLKYQLGHALNAEEQEILDADEPSERELAIFLADLNTVHFQRDRILLCICNSGRRSRIAVEILRRLGYARSYSILDGWRAWCQSPLREKHPQAA